VATLQNKGGIYTGFRVNSYATIFSIEPGKGNWTKCRVSISRKNRDTGEYEQDFGGYVMMIGPAHAKAQKLRERDRIQLKEVDVSNRYDKEKQREYTDFKCFDFDMAEGGAGGGGQRQQAQRAIGGENPVDGSDDPDDSLPF